MVTAMDQTDVLDCFNTDVVPCFDIKHRFLLRRRSLTPSALVLYQLVAHNRKTRTDGTKQSVGTRRNLSEPVSGS